MKGGIEIDIWSSLSRFYSLSLFQVCYIMLCLIAIWTVIPVFSKCKIYRWWKKFNILSFAFSLLLIIKMTLLMNVILFLPFGLTIPYVAEVIKIRKNKFRWILCMVSGFLLSVAIESFQYYFCLGRAETDDVICNTLGCVGSYGQCHIISKKKAVYKGVRLV